MSCLVLGLGYITIILLEAIEDFFYYYFVIQLTAPVVVDDSAEDDGMSVKEVLLGTAALHVALGDLAEPGVRNVPQGRHERLVLRTWRNENPSE